MRHGYRKPAQYHALFAVCLTLVLMPLGALEISQGRVRLTLHEHTGRFSLYGVNNRDLYEPFFSDKDPRTSFIELSINDRIYRLGESAFFRFRFETAADVPAIVFDSGTVQVREEFSFVKTAGSPVSNGVQVNIRVRNLRPGDLTVGLRVLLDTFLGEGNNSAPFFVNDQRVLAETLIAGNIDSPWISRGQSLGLMGSIKTGAETHPDYLLFANWKRLNETSRKPSYNTGRNFNYPPYSFGDSAVCYYYSPKLLSQYNEINIAIILAAEDSAGFNSSGDSSPKTVPENSAATPPEASPPPAPTLETGEKEADLALLHNLMGRLDQYLAGQIEITEEELAAMELTVTRLKARYNLP